jgi:hypothetical protein
MANNVTLSAGTTTTAGKVWTFGMLTAGVTGSGYAVTNTTGLTLTVDGFPTYIASVAVVGTDLLVTAGFPARVGATVTLGVTAAATITDGSGNTPTGQSSVSTTNTSPVTVNGFAFPDARMVSAGPYSTGSVLSHTYIGGAFDVKLYVNYTGTDAAIFLFGGAEGGASVVVDGTSITTPAGVSGWTRIPITSSSLTDASHTLVITVPPYLRSDVLIEVAGASPTITAPTTVFPAVSLTDGAYSNAIVQDGSWGPWAGSSLFRQGIMGSTLRFRATVTGLGFWLYASNVDLVLLVDGVFSQSGKLTTNSGTGYITFSGLDGTAEHLYELVSAQVIGSTLVVASVMPIGGSINTAANLSPAKSLDAYYGDSIEAGAFLTLFTDSFMFKASRLLGRVACSVGASGVSLVGALENNTANITGLAGVNAATTRIFARSGTNDNESDVTSGTFLTSATHELNALKSGAPLATVYRLALLPESTFGPRNAALASAATAAGVAFVSDTQTFNITAGTNTSDGRHPNASGSSVLANNLALRLASPAAYTLNVSGTGLAATATVSTALTGTTFNGAASLTVAWGDGNTSPVTPTAGQTTATASHTYAGAGAKTVTPTNAQGWTDPAAATFTATAAGNSVTLNNGVFLKA